jgi:hypothetical protein
LNLQKIYEQTSSTTQQTTSSSTASSPIINHARSDYFTSRHRTSLGLYQIIIAPAADQIREARNNKKSKKNPTAKKRSLHHDDVLLEQSTELQRRSGDGHDSSIYAADDAWRGFCHAGMGVLFQQRAER